MFPENLRSLALKTLEELDFGDFLNFRNKLAPKKLPSIHLYKKLLTKMTISQKFFYFNSVKSNL